EYLDVYFLPVMAALIESGARILVGTDAPVAALPGIGLHQELQFLVGAGMTPAAALRAATHDAAEALGVADRGTIAPGQRADLLLLDADPLADIDNSRAIAGVLLHGQWLPAAELDAMRS